MPEDCLFCRIVAGAVPATVVRDGARTLAFRDINPQAPTHVLVIPRKHVASLSELEEADEALFGHLLRVAAVVAGAEGLKESGFRTVINSGAGAGQSVFHVHLHVLGGRQINWPPG